MKKLLLNIILSIIALGLCLLALEVSLRLKEIMEEAISAEGPEEQSEVPLYVVCDCPFLYRLNSEHPEISTQGLRDREYIIPKPEGTTRLLMLGDSVTYGEFVPAESTFPKQLEQKLQQTPIQAQVINAGVSGYTPYNELQYYLSEGHTFEPDIVIVVFVMNDVVDPELHWSYSKETLPMLPPEAIPNPNYHRDHILPIIEARRSAAFWRKSALYNFVQARLDQQLIDETVYASADEQGFAYENGRRWPTFITGEDTISIKVLLDYGSPEWQWLRTTYDQLHQAVTRDGATFIILVVPLAYQLEEGYPYLPQEFIQRYCEETSIYCLDLLPIFQKHRQEQLYLGTHLGFNDIWHLTERGHQLTAEAITAYLSEHNFLSQLPQNSN